jgi:hypothetical protein
MRQTVTGLVNVGTPFAIAMNARSGRTQIVWPVWLLRRGSPPEFWAETPARKHRNAASDHDGFSMQPP